MIAFLDLRAQHEPLLPDFEKALREVVGSSEFCLGSRVERFEQAFARFCGVRHAIGVNSGTSALHLALLAIGVGPGNEVLTVPSTFVATLAAIRYCGARPVLVDIEPERFTMDPARVEAAITARTAAIVPVHLYGQMADMEPIRDIARRRGIPVIEDAAQAIGAEYREARAGSMGVLGCFSFYPGKILGALGEGGAITTDDDSLAAQLRAMRDWGQFERAVHHYPCFNYRMDGLQGAFLEIKLRRVEAWIEARRRIAAHYDRLFAEHGAAVATPRPCPDGVHAYHQYAVRIEDRDQLQAELASQGIGTAIHYPTPAHLQPGFADLGYRRGDFPNAEALAKTTLSLPIYPELAESAVAEVVERLAQCAGERRRPALQAAG